MAEKIKYRVSERLEDEGKEEAAEIAREEIDKFFTGGRSKKKVVEALRDLGEEQRREPPEITRRVNEKDLF